MFTLTRECGQGQRISYALLTDGAFLARFDSLADAGAVLRYLGGTKLDNIELTRTIRILDELDERQDNDTGS